MNTITSLLASLDRAQTLLQPEAAPATLLDRYLDLRELAQADLWDEQPATATARA